MQLIMEKSQEMERKINWRRGSGEFIAFALISFLISSIVLLLVAVLQFSSSLNDIMKALEASGRAAAVCTSFEDANRQVQRVAESASTDRNIRNIQATVEYATSNTDWESGTYLLVTVSADYQNLLFSGHNEKSVLITVENMAGNVIIIPEIADGRQIGSAMTITVYEEINWTRGTKQYEVYEAWRRAGSQYSDGIAVLDGYYLIACTQLYGQVGDRVQFTLENGQVLNCIIADSKSASDANYTQYGHAYGNTVLVLEMEVDGAYYRQYGNPATANWKPEWNSRPARCKNMGNYI